MASVAPRMASLFFRISYSWHCKTLTFSKHNGLQSNKARIIFYQSRQFDKDDFFFFLAAIMWLFFQNIRAMMVPSNCLVAIPLFLCKVMRSKQQSFSICYMGSVQSLNSQDLVVCWKISVSDLMISQYPDSFCL